MQKLPLLAPSETIHSSPTRVFDLGHCGVLKIHYNLGWINSAGHYQSHYSEKNGCTEPAACLDGGWIIAQADEGVPAQSIWLSADAVRRLAESLVIACSEAPPIPDWHTEGEIES